MCVCVCVCVCVCLCQASHHEGQKWSVYLKFQGNAIILKQIIVFHPSKKLLPHIIIVWLSKQILYIFCLVNDMKSIAPYF